MEIHLTQALNSVKLALGDVAQKASNRRLRVLQNRAPCKKGCNGCCSRLLSISIAEASLIVEYLRHSGEWEEVRGRARGQFRASQDTPPLTWFKMNVKCPVLNTQDGSCMAYETRPAVCSTHFVTSIAEGCYPWSTQAVVYEQYDMMDLYDEFQKRLMQHVDQFGIMQLSMPIPVALLVAERIQTKTLLSVPEIVALLYNEFSSNQSK